MRLIKKACALSVVILLAILLVDHHARATANRRFGNMTYFTDSPYLVEQVTLRDGSFEGRYGRLFYGLYFEGQYVSGDFNHDSLEDAAVIISQSQNGSAENQTLAFLINDGTQLVHRQSASLGDRTIVHSLSEQDGKVLIDMFVHQPGDCMAGPTKRVRYVYGYNGQGRWVRGALVKVLPPRKLRIL